MLADPKARRLSTEFFGQWLGFYHFDQFRGVDTARFPEFTDEVKSSMYDEAVSFFEHVIRKDRPVREILFADYGFLNQPLAKFYGVKKEVKSTGPVELVEGAGSFQRGGLLRLGAILTATSAPLRTSPVKRGDWVLRRILGTPVPPPPADAGKLPADDKDFGDLSLREKLEAHKRNATCANCHMRIDPLGFPLEHYDSTGRWREKYSDGKPIDDSGVLSDKTEIAGVHGLLDYLKRKEDQVRRTLATKLVGYALGRTVQASDQLLIDRMVATGGNATFSQLAAEIVTSQQFRSHLGRDDAPARRRQDRCGAETIQRGRCTMKTELRTEITPSLPARRRRRARSAVAGIAAPAGAGCAGRAGRRSQQASAALRLHLLLQRRRSHPLVGQRQRRRHGIRPRRRAARAHPRRPGLRPRALQPDRARLHQPPPGPHEHALRRQGEPRPQRHSRRRHHGSGAWPSTSAIRPSCPASRSASSPTNFAWKTASPCSTAPPSPGPPPPNRPPRKSIPRVPSTSSWATARAANSTAAFSTRCCRRPTTCSRRSPPATARSSTSIWNPCATSRSASTAPANRSCSKAGAPRCKQPNMPRPSDEIPQNPPDHMKLMLDLIVLAFQMDKTRIVTCMLNNDLSQMNFKFVEGVRGALHLDLTHGKTPATKAMYLKTNQFHMQQFTYLVQRMKQIDEGGQSLLDNSMLMFASSLYDGDLHGADQMPIVLAGKAGGAMKTGRILDYPRQGQRQSPRLQSLSLDDGPHGRKAGSLRRHRQAPPRPLRVTGTRPPGLSPLLEHSASALAEVRCRARSSRAK